MPDIFTVFQHPDFSDEGQQPIGVPHFDYNDFEGQQQIAVPQFGSEESDVQVDSTPEPDLAAAPADESTHSGESAAPEGE